MSMPPPPSPDPIVVKGTNGTVSFDGRIVTITRTGVARMTVGGGEKRIPIGSVTAVQWKAPSMFTRGYMALSVHGETAVRSRAGRQVIDAGKDENAVLFGKKQLADFTALRDRIEAAIG
jgi:Domain of unknown function (DUF4429)